METDLAPFKTCTRTEFVPHPDGAGAHVVALRDRIVERAYREAIDLALATRDYVRGRQQAHLHRAEPMLSMRISSEALRVTARLTQVVAWLLTQKAVSLGEIPASVLEQPAHRLGGGPAVASPNIETADELPAELVDLLNRSWSIYDRVRRLDAAWRPAAAA